MDAQGKTALSTLPRNEKLKLFEPHMSSFDCASEATRIPPQDAEAEQWFREARALESPEIYIDDRDYEKIVRLTRQAAERKHWKAMLNLASLYLEGHDAAHGEADAVQLVEDGIRLGIPAAYDQMGTYYMNGTGVPQDATRAYAFWQKAAMLGEPNSLAYLGERLIAIEDNIVSGYWANIPIGTKMLECALAQGFGPAAYELHDIYLEPMLPDGKHFAPATTESRLRAMRVLHEGAKLGCLMCAQRLYIEFDNPLVLSETIVPNIDKARSQRYRILATALDFNPNLRFPNIDQILPLPPATLPAWNGDEDTLIQAATGVTVPPRRIKAPKERPQSGTPPSRTATGPIAHATGKLSSKLWTVT